MATSSEALDLPGTGDSSDCASEALNLLCMPGLLLYKIVRELCPDAQDLVRVSLTCKTLQRACDEVSIWQHVLELRFGKNIVPAPEQAGKPQVKCATPATNCQVVGVGKSCQFQSYVDQSLRILKRCCIGNLYLLTTSTRTCLWHP